MSVENTLMDAARDGEPDRFAAALLAPEPQRQALLAIAAFSAELRRIPVSVKEPMMGEVRLQWWRECIAAQTVSGNPIADALIAAVDAYSLPRPALLGMVEARAFDLYADPMPDAASLRGYLARTEAAPFELALRVLGRVADDNDAALIADAGRAYGLARILSDLPHWLRRGRCPLPVAELEAAGVTEAMLADAEPTPAMTALIAGMVSDISATCDAARPRVVTLSRQQRLAFLPLAVVRSYVHALNRPARSPLREPVTVSPLVRMTRIGLARVMGQF